MDDVFLHIAILHFGVPQCPVLGSILFIIYTLPNGNIIETSGLHAHFYADDIRYTCPHIDIQIVQFLSRYITGCGWRSFHLSDAYSSQSQSYV